MTVAPAWLLRLAGHDLGRERILAEASRTEDRRLLDRDLAQDETRFRARMAQVARGPHAVLGTSVTGVPYRIALDDLTSLPSWITGATGSGKSRFIGSFMSNLVEQIGRGEPVSVVVIDGKGETCDQLLRSTAAVAEGLPPRVRASFLNRVHTFRVFSPSVLPSWPLLARMPGVSIAAQADAVADVLSEIVADV